MPNADSAFTAAPLNLTDYSFVRCIHQLVPTGLVDFRAPWCGRGKYDGTAFCQEPMLFVADIMANTGYRGQFQYPRWLNIQSDAHTDSFT